MNKEEILYEISKTKEHLANMEKMLQECEYERWKPIKGEQYYFINYWGEIESDTFNEVSYCDSGRYKNFNCFRTKEQAESEAEKILVRLMLEDIARRLNKGEKIDWEDDRSQPKSCIELCGDKITSHFYFNYKTQGAVYCLDKTFKDVAIQEIGEERLKNYLRGE